MIKMQFSCTLVSFSFLLVILAVSGEIYMKKGTPYVKLNNKALLSGSVHFSRDNRPYSSFLGIQYANVPQRFAAAELTTPEWEGIKSALSHGPMCPQKSGFGDSGELTGKEDCLYLDVYVPINSTTKQNYPVIIWLHGGWYVVGSGSTYGPEFFMDEDVILMTINHRLGVFGFLSTGDEIIPGNNALKDQVLALKWVQQNIGQFGGNKNNVNVVGLSAGGASAHYLTLSDTTKGLFHHAISLSGSALAPWVLVPDPKSIAIKLATHLSCPTTSSHPSGIKSEEILSCLRDLPMETLNKAQFGFASTWPLNLMPLKFAPVVEPRSTSSTNIPFIVESPHAILLNRSRALREIPWIVGAVHDEGCTWLSGIVLSQEALVKDLNENWDTVISSAMLLDRYFAPEEQTEIAQKLRQFYFGGQLISSENGQGLTDMYSDNYFNHDTFRSAIETAARGKGNPVYYYQYSYPGPVQILGGPHMPERESKLIGHADDLQHLFTLKGMLPGLEADIIVEPSDVQFSKNLVRLWTSFVAHGKPLHTWGNNKNRKWEPVSQSEVNKASTLKVFKIDGNPRFVEHTRAERMAFWDQLWVEHYIPAILGKLEEKVAKIEL